MYKWNLEVYRTSFARGLLVHGTKLTIFWFFRVRYGTDPRSVSMAPLGDSNPYPRFWRPTF